MDRKFTSLAIGACATLQVLSTTRYPLLNDDNVHDCNGAFLAAENLSDMWCRLKTGTTKRKVSFSERAKHLDNPGSIAASQVKAAPLEENGEQQADANKQQSAWKKVKSLFVSKKRVKIGAPTRFQQIMKDGRPVTDDDNADLSIDQSRGAPAAEDPVATAISRSDHSALLAARDGAHTPSRL